MCKKVGGGTYFQELTVYGHNLKSEIFSQVTASYSNDVLNCITVTTVALGTGKQDRKGKREQETEICGSRRDRKNGAKVANLNCL